MKLWNHRGKKGDGGQCCKEIDRLADFFLRKHSDQIQEGTAVDNAIRLLEEYFHRQELQKRAVILKEISDFVDQEWADCQYGCPESYEVKGMIADFLKKILDIEVKGK